MQLLFFLIVHVIYSMLWLSSIKKYKSIKSETKGKNNSSKQKKQYYVLNSCTSYNILINYILEKKKLIKNNNAEGINNNL